MSLWLTNPLLYNVCVRQGLQKAIGLHPTDETIAKTLYRCRIMGSKVTTKGTDIFINGILVKPCELQDYQGVIQKISRDLD